MTGADRATTRGPIRVHRGALPAIIVSLIFASVTLYVTQAWAQIDTGPSVGTDRANSDAATTRTIRLGDRPELDIPVATVTHWWAASDAYGRIDVYVPIGRTPRQALTIELASRGYQVVG